VRRDRFLGALLLFAHLARHLIRRRPPLALRDRLAMLPRTGLPITVPVTIHWDEHQIPFIKAETDRDLAVALGLVHAHLRLGQIEMMRRLSQGRVAEMIGPLGIEIDRLVRTLDIARAVPEMARAMPEETRGWLDAFVSGLNHYIARAETLPQEFQIFGLQREPWSSRDVLTLGRLVSGDVNWIVWLRLLALRGDPDWPSLWRRLLEHDLFSPEDIGAKPDDVSEALDAALRSGSNSFVLSAARSASGAPVLASDPHLSLFLPNPWLIAGMKSRSHHAVGLMIPGLPFIALGRNPRIAWGGTSLHAASSDLVVVPTDGSAEIRDRIDTLSVRWGRRRKIHLRESSWGPIVTDIPWLRSGGDTLALRWIGHRPSEEMTAMLRVNRAGDWAEFRAALEGFAVPGQHMLYADIAGHIGHLMAAHLPHRTGPAAADLATEAAAEGWGITLTSARLPSGIDPPAGFIASANERPAARDLIIGHHFSPPDRKRRLDQLLSAEPRVSVEAARKIQRDVRWTAALAERDTLLAWLGPGGQRRGPRQARLIADLSGWDGDYGANSRGALAFELISYHLARRLVGRRRREAYAASWGMRGLIWQDVRSAAPERRERALKAALRDAARAMRRRALWGGTHRLRLGHPLMLMPLLGRAWRVADLPAAGSSETLLKTAHSLTGERHASRYGSCARHISDLAEPSRNDFVLLGGQDGWLGSSTFADQVALWQRGDYIRVPLTLERVAAVFPYRTELTP
jgi:penicillin G amidase